MSVNIPAVDLSAAKVGTEGTVGWAGLVQTGAPVGVRAGRPVLRLFNESGCGLAYTIGVSSDRLPAGGWVDLQLKGDNSLSYLVEYVLPGQPVSLLLGVIYEPGEPIPPLPQLGNSPIGIGGQVATSGAGGTDSILNSGNAPGTSTYSATPSDQAGASIAEANDASGYRKVLSAGVLRTILNVVRGNATSGKASVQLGDSGDASITTFYGQVGAGSAVPASTIIGTLPAGQVGSGYPAGNISGTVANANYANSAGSVTTASNANLLNDGANVQNGRLGHASSGDMFDFQGGAGFVYYKGNGAGTRTRFQPNPGTTVAAFVDSTGTQLIVNNGFQYGSGGADDAELQWTDDPGATPAATVVCFQEDAEHGGKVAPCTHSDCPSAGVISTAPVGIKGGDLMTVIETHALTGELLREEMPSDDPHWVPLALEGKVPVRVVGDPSAYVPGQTVLVSAGDGRMRAWRDGDRWPRGVVVSTRSDVNRRPLAPGCVLALLSY